ncbi:hypothetical protein N0V84_005417 [Fusarium piperis]|uniref:Uncharacterized protein n=1 Tax=Fusarium piperis TaxID=1435070 RepID=A0A9W8WDQ0_9HYPO|nr:hypothetical protein N0V84_005417 [Fusarium piperis]
MLEDNSGQPNMASQEDPAANKIRRTSFSPWSSGIMGSRPGAVPKSQAQGPEPSRIVSDILEGAAVKASVAGGLASNAKIQALQKEWERNNAQIQVHAAAPFYRAFSAIFYRATRCALTQASPA